MDFSQNVKKNTFKIVAWFFLGIFLGAFVVFAGFYKNIFSLETSLLSEIKTNWIFFWQDTDTVKNSSKTPFFQSKKLQKIYSIIEKNFYGFENKNQEEVESAMAKAMVEALGDNHSEYFTSEDAEEFDSELSGNFVGIGAVVNEEKWIGIRIERILPESPAEKSGLLAGDIVVSVWDTSVVGMTSAEAVKLIRWKKKTPVIITFVRDGETRMVSVIRDEVNIPSVDEQKIENSDIWYIQINTFGERTPQEFHTAIKKLKQEWVKWLVLDFRFNGGWYLLSAQKMLEEFLPRNSLIVTMKENNPINNESLYTSLLSSADIHIPIVVLVNEFSASASEIVAGAIQDYHRGIIIGKKTYGKGSVQEKYPFSDGSMMKITVAHWYTPKDRSIEQKWIEPDIVIDFKDEDYKTKFDRQKDTAIKVLNKLIKGESMDTIITQFK